MGRGVIAVLLALAVLLPGRGTAGDELLRLRQDLRPVDIVINGYGAMLPAVAVTQTRFLSSRATVNVTDCLRADLPGAVVVDLASYDWPGTRSARDHQTCLLAIFNALGDRNSIRAWVATIVAPQAHPGCPARWNVEEVSDLGPATVDIWRGRQTMPLIIGVMDHKALWSDTLRAPVYSLIRTTFDADDRPLVVKVEIFTIGDRYGLQRCR